MTEETPMPTLTAEEEERILRAAMKAARDRQREERAGQRHPSCDCLRCMVLR